MKHRVCFLFIALNIFFINTVFAKESVYGGGEWEVIGIGNLPCEKYLENIKYDTYKDAVFNWVSGFMSGVNFSTTGVYDITNGDDIEIVMKLIERYCQKNHLNQLVKLLQITLTQLSI